MKILELKASPSTVGVTNLNEKRRVIILGYNVTIQYQDGTKKKSWYRTIH